MIEVLKAILLDFLEEEVPMGVPRRLDVEPAPGKAAVFIGVRRSGKSTFFFQLMNRLSARGVPRENILYLNFFDDRLSGLEREGLGSITEAYYSLYPEKKNREKVYIFFDEVQGVRGWEPFVDRLMRTEKCQVHLTGSSARMLSKEIATQMRGRALTWEIFPFSFIEFLDYKGIDVSGGLSTRKRLQVKKAFEEFWEKGGFPEVAGMSPRLRVMTHQEYFHAILFRDLVERHDISHPRAVLDLARRLLDRAGYFYTINSLFGYLKSLGHKIPKSAVSDYLDWFEDAFFLFSVRLFDASWARSRVNPKKVYCVDHAMVASVGSGILVNRGHLLENLVFTALRRKTPDIFYGKTKGGGEVDFIALWPKGRRRLFQVCETLKDQEARKREVSSLAAAMKELGTNSAVIVTRWEEEVIDLDGKVIEVLPAWKFLLSL